ncbi:hypothetical protein ACFW1M_27885 [Streptomyces inhibens]|uniref:hypothetical protein n=1 Tax=Streptomyces inhibens TaxID=2293571 RepID=UPI003690C52B
MALALHHLGALLGDLTDERQARSDAAAVTLNLRVCEDLTGANGGAEYDDSSGQGEMPRGEVSGIGGAADAEVPLPAAGAAPCPALDEVLAAAQRITWACTNLRTFFVPDASRDILDVALAAVRAQERGGYVRRLEAFAERHRGRLEEMLRAYGPGSAPAECGRYVLVGQPESLVICERLESTLMLLHGVWDGELEGTLLDDLAFAGGPDTALAGEQPARRGRARDQATCLAGRKVRCPRCGPPGAADLLGARQRDESPPSGDRSAVEDRHDLLAVVAPHLVVTVRLGLRELLRFARRLRGVLKGTHGNPAIARGRGGEGGGGGQRNGDRRGTDCKTDTDTRTPRLHNSSTR